MKAGRIVADGPPRVGSLLGIGVVAAAGSLPGGVAGGISNRPGRGRCVPDKLSVDVWRMGNNVCLVFADRVDTSFSDRSDPE